MHLLRAFAAFFRGFANAQRKDSSKTEDTAAFLRRSIDENKGFLADLQANRDSASDVFGTGFVDLRDPSEAKIERTAQKSLSGGNESIAKVLCRLSRESQNMHDAKFKEMERLGAQLYAKGGHQLMQLVCYRVRVLGGSHTYLSTAWDGVGQWRD